MSERTLQQEIEARRPATEGTLRQLATVMNSLKSAVDSVKTAWDGIMVDEGVDLNG